MLVYVFIFFHGTGGYAGPAQGAYGKKLKDRGDPLAATQWYN